MTGWLGVAVYCVAVVAIVLAVVWWADWSLAYDDRRRQSQRARSVFPQDQTWAYTPDHGGDEPGLAAEYDLEVYVAEAMRVANGDDPR